MRVFAMSVVIWACRAQDYGGVIPGEYCAFPNGTDGTCIQLQDCEAAIDLLIEQIEPSICGFSNDEPLFCCVVPQKYQEERERIAKHKCDQYGRFGVDYGAKSIIGGFNASPREFTHMAALGYGTKNNKQWFCGGSLISEKFVLTAAHCLYSRSHGSVRWIRLGDLDLTSTKDDASPQEFSIERAVHHPDYRPPSTYNDIALIEMNGFAVFSEYVSPACLHMEGDVVGSVIYATGWGIVDSGGQWGNHLQAVLLPVADLDDCMRIYTRSRRLMNGLMSTQLCVGGGHDMKDTCQGDSGGPLQYIAFSSTGMKRYTILAITSFGKQCGLAGSPSVYTRVAPYVPWIESVVWPN